MSVYEPHSRPEEKWGHWEDKTYIRQTFAGESESFIAKHLDLQVLLKGAGFIGIPGSGGSGRRFYQSIWICSRKFEYDLSEGWYEQGELFGEWADSKFVHWEISSQGSSPEDALANLLATVRDNLTEDSLSKLGKIVHLQLSIKTQKNLVSKEQAKLQSMENELEKLKESKDQ